MAAKQKSSRGKIKPGTTFTWRKAVFTAASAAAALVLVIQVALDVHFWHSANYASDGTLASMIIQSVKGVDKPAVMEPASKKVYLPDANLVLPPYPQNMPDIEYSYTPSLDGSDAEASVTVTNAVDVGISQVLNAQAGSPGRRNPDTLFAAVPDLQVCVRGVHVVFGSKTTYDHLQFTKTLGDGRTMHVYTEARNCIYPMQPLVEYLRSAESY